MEGKSPFLQPMPAKNTMTPQALSMYDRCAGHLEALRRAETDWICHEQWLEALVRISRDVGDAEAERHLRQRLLDARLVREVAARQTLVMLNLFLADM